MASRAFLWAATLAGVAAQAACGPSVSLLSLSLDGVDDDAVRLRAELDTRLGADATESHMIMFSYLIFEAGTSSPEELERRGERAPRDPATRAGYGRFYGSKRSGAQERVREGHAVLMEAERPGPPFLNDIHVPRRPPPERPEFALEKGRRYAIVLRVSGRIPTGGYPFVFSRPFETNARAVCVEIPR